jgi:CheY-like chemotaxis protein
LNHDELKGSNMKKIIIADVLLSLLDKEGGFLQRTEVERFTATTNDEILAVHRAEKADLIITQLDMPGFGSELLCSTIRKDEDLRRVSLLLICRDDEGDRERASRCNPNAVLTHPVDADQLLEKAQQLLNVPWRGAFRVLLRVRIEGNDKDKAFFCRSENISTSGLLIETERTFEKGDRVVCSFFLPDSRQLIAHGEVSRMLKKTAQQPLNRYGIKFSRLAPDVQSAIETFVERKYQQSTWKPS